MARRSPRQARSFRRQAPARAQYEVALIVCEGEKTEPEYLKALRKACDLNPANVRIVAADGNDPMSIVREAIETYHSTSRVRAARTRCAQDQSRKENGNRRECRQALASPH